jgi:hypothetical protein
VGISLGAQAGSGPSGAPGAGSGQPIRPSHLPSGYPQDVVSFLVILVAILTFLFWRSKGVLARGTRSPPAIVPLVLALLGTLIMVVLLPQYVLPTIGTVVTDIRGISIVDPRIVWYLTIFVVVSAVGLPLLYIRSLRRNSESLVTPNEGNSRARQIFASAIDDAIYSLRNTSNHRLEVINCYKTLCSVLQEGGAPSSPVLTAREFEALAAEKLDIKTGYLRMITQLFEKARYSTYAVDESDARIAEDNLVALESELKNRTASIQGGDVPAN